MAKFHAKCGTYQIAYKRGAKLMEIIEVYKIVYQRLFKET